MTGYVWRNTEEQIEGVKKYGHLFPSLIKENKRKVFELLLSTILKSEPAINYISEIDFEDEECAQVMKEAYEKCIEEVKKSHEWIKREIDDYFNPNLGNYKWTMGAPVVSVEHTLKEKGNMLSLREKCDLIMFILLKDDTQDYGIKWDFSDLDKRNKVILKMAYNDSSEELKERYSWIVSC